MNTLDELLAKKAGIQLDIGCGASKQSEAWVGMDIRNLPGVDIVHDFNVHPWPLPDECCNMILASHVLEHVPGVAIIDGKTRFLFVEFMDEAWRILKPDGKFAIAVPHGSSQGFLQDPTHVNAMNEARWAYFDPLHPSGLYKIYKPKPWKIADGFPQWNPSANMEVLLIKRREDRSYYD